MKKHPGSLALTGLAGILIVCTVIFSFSGKADAGANPVPIEGIAYNVNASIADNLKALVGKTVFIHLDSGASFAGVIKTIGPQLVHLEKLDQKDFFDALIEIQHIVAIDTQFRTY